MPYRKILCPIDFSEPSRAALHAAAELAVLFDATLTLVHVYQTPLLTYPEVMPDSGGLRTSMLDLVGKSLAEAKREAEQLARRSVTAVSIEGVAWDQIVKLGREQQQELIVLGTHGRTGLAHAFMGSVAEKVVRHAASPVLVVRSPSDS